MHIRSTEPIAELEQRRLHPEATAAAAGFAPAGPLAQSVSLTFRLITASTMLLALVWFCGNIRQVPSDTQAVVQRFGRVTQVKNAGLLLAWPRPFEQVRLLPAIDRQIPLDVAAEPTPYTTDETDLQLQPNDDVIHLERDRDTANASYLLTGDGNVVRLEATLYFRISGPAAYVLTETHVAPALRRLFLASAVTLTASRRLDDFLVAQPDTGADMGLPPEHASDPLLLARRAGLRADLVAAVNTRLDALRASGSDLGVQVTRIDLLAVLPPRAKAAFDEVLTAGQIADQNIAAARTDATRTLQEANRGRDRRLDEADADGVERVRSAIADTATVTALEASLSGTPNALREAMRLKAWREHVSAILRQAGEVTAVDGRSGRNAVLPGPSQPQSGGAAP